MLTVATSNGRRPLYGISILALLLALCAACGTKIQPGGSKTTGGTSTGGTTGGTTTGGTTGGTTTGGTTGGVDTSNCPTPAPSVTFSNNIAPIITTHCIRCHSFASADRQGAPTDTNFDTAQGFRAKAVLAVDYITSAFMPFDQATVVSAEQRCTVAAWIAQNTPD